MVDEGTMQRRVLTNAAQLGIEVSEDDLQVMMEQGFLAMPQAFAAWLAHAPLPDTLPDFLWEPMAAPVEQTAPVEPTTMPAVRPRGQLPTLAELAVRLRRREVSAAELVEQALEQIARLDPHLNAFQCVLADEARAAAREADAALARGEDHGPLHGIPVAVKDLLDLAGTPTTAGGRLLADRLAERDASVVNRLRQAGAIVLGKTRLTEFAYSPASDNPHYGPTRNPWDRTRDAGGSSSGSGAAVAAGMVVAALGSDTGGSIRIPATFCGIVGLKPTFGRVSLTGAVPLSWSLDHLGPMTRSVVDAALVLAAIAGPDPADPRTSRTSSWGMPAFSADVRGLRVGVVRGDGGTEPLGEPEVMTACERAAAALADAGGLIEDVTVPELSALRVINSVLIGLEAQVVHLPWLRTQREAYGAFLRARLLATLAYPPGSYLLAQRWRAQLRQQMAERMRVLDLLLLPTVPHPAPPLGVIVRNTWHTSPFNALGWPALSLPGGLAETGLPVGVQLVGRPWEEATVLRAGAVVEAAGIGPGDPPLVA